MDTTTYRTRCREIMLALNLFANPMEIRTLFMQNGTLQGHANYLDLPSMGSPSTYVDAVLSYLANLKQSELTLLIELMTLLYSRTADEQTQSDISQLQAKLELLRQTELTVIVVAMRDDQAAQLFATIEDAAEDAAEAQTRHKLRRLLADPSGKGFGLDLASLCSCYKRNPGEWEPFGGGKSILSILNEIKDGLTPLEGWRLPKITPIDGSQLIFAPEAQPSKLATALSGRICLLIIDAVSLLHPAISAALREAPLTKVPRMAMVVLTPHGGYLTALRRLHELLMGEVAEAIPPQLASFTDPAQILLEFGIVDDLTLRRRIRTIMPHLMRSDLGLQATMERAHEGRASKGLSKAVFG